MINDAEYEAFVCSLAKPGADILASLTPEKVDAWHMATGVCTEAGELLDAVKKYVVYEKPVDLENILEELGDLEYYMAGIRMRFQINRKNILRKNEEKLKKRYSKGYSNKQASERADKNGS